MFEMRKYKTHNSIQVRDLRDYYDGFSNFLKIL